MAMPRSCLRAFLAAGLLSIVAGHSAVAQTDKTAPQSRAEITLSFAPVVRKAQPSVVNVYASRTEPRPSNPLFDDPVFRRFFGGGDGGPTAQSLGSGVVVDATGLVVTNYHVIEGMTIVKVALADKREYEAEIALRDQRTDLAVLKLKNAANLPAMELGDSDALEVGDLALAIGNPFGVGQTVTQGIISAVARTQIGISDYGFFIQTDAAINPGNSGGALIDMEARLVGINSAIFSKSGGSVGIGFAIPVNMVKIVVAAARSGGTKVRRPWLGASLQTVSQDIADSIGLERPSGALVTDIRDNSPAADAGLKRGDVVTSVDGKTVEDPDSVGYRIGTKAIGGTAIFGVLRGGKKMSVNVALSQAPERPARDAIKIKGTSPFAGATVWNVSPATIEELSLDNIFAGVVVGDVDPDTPAAGVNFQRGDLILAVNDAKIAATGDLEKATGGRHYFWKITLQRGGQVLTTVIGG
jgi:Do/DeqQ family serine protease